MFENNFKLESKELNINDLYLRLYNTKLQKEYEFKRNEEYVLLLPKEVRGLQTIAYCLIFLEKGKVLVRVKMFGTVRILLVACTVLCVFSYPLLSILSNYYTIPSIAYLILPVLCILQVLMFYLGFQSLTSQIQNRLSGILRY